MFSSFLQDLRYAVRSFARTPGVALLAIATLAVGVGANAAIFSVIHGVLIEPLPYPAAERIVIPWRHNPRLGSVSVSPSRRDIEKWQQAPSFEAWTTYSRERVVLAGGDEPEQLSALLVDSRFLDFSGTQLQIGRRFVADDSASDAGARGALLTHALWQNRFGGDRATGPASHQLASAFA